MGDNAQLKYSYPQHFRYLHCARNESLPQEGSFQANIHQCEIFGYNQIKFNFYKSLENHNPIQKSLMEQIGSFHDLIMLWCSNQQRNVDKVAKVIQKVNAPLKSSFSSWWLGIQISYGKICKREIGLVPISILYVVEQGRILDTFSWTVCIQNKFEIYFLPTCLAFGVQSYRTFGQSVHTTLGKYLLVPLVEYLTRKK